MTSPFMPVCSADRLEHQPGMRKLAKIITKNLGAARRIASRYERKRRVSSGCTDEIAAALQELQGTLEELTR
jgi:hypothetical protein